VVEVGVLEEVAEIFASLRDVDTALRRFVELARRIGGTRFGAIYLRDATGELFQRWAESAETPMSAIPSAPVDAEFGGGGHRRLSLADVRLDDLPGVAHGRERGVRSVLAFGMWNAGELVGLLALGFEEEAALDEARIRTLDAVARFPAAAIQQARTREVADRRAHLTDILRRFGEQALTTTDEAALHRVILETAAALTGSDQASIARIGDGKIRVIAGIGKDAALVGTEAPVEAVAEALSSTEPYVVSDVDRADDTKLLIQLARKNQARSFMVLPLRHQDRLFGHLFAGAAEVHRYLAEEVEAMRILASMAAAILEQRRMQDAAERQTRRLDATIEHLPMLIEVFDASGRCVQSNAAAQAWRARVKVGIGTTASLFPGLCMVELDGRPVVKETCPSTRALDGHSFSPRELVLLDGQQKRVATLLIAAAPIIAPETGRVEAVVVGCQDVSRLHELAQAKDRFLRVAAHELRSPITSLHTTTQLIEVAPEAFDDPAQRAAYLGRIRRQSGRLVKLVQQLLDTVRFDAHELPLQRTEVDLTALCREVVETTMPAEGPRAVLRAGEPVVGRWDAVRIEQVLTNLLSNAARYSPREREVEVTVRREGSRALLLVSDRGIGIPASQIDQLFTPFFRATNATARHAGGMGLGLHIAREIVRRHGGSIAVESRENEGTTFTVELPLANSEAAT
jgi:signal transduction histidine kinase/GAF domain-containing protein